VYTVVTAVLGLGLTASTALAVKRDASNAGLVQRALILVYVVWIVLLSVHLLRRSVLEPAVAARAGRAMIRG
jgi:hypothetical protein